MANSSILYDLTKEELQDLCDNSSSLKEIETSLHVAHKTLVKVLKEKNIDLTRLKSNKGIRDDLTGKKYGRLTAIEIDKKKNKGNTYYICRCECGNIISVIGSHLKNGHTSSCGCKKIEGIKRRFKKYNVYDLSSEYGVGYTTNTNTPFYFDKEDYEKIKEYAWRDNGYGYIISSCREKDKKIMMHRLIMPCEESYVIDHINHNPADNRKINLRICTQQENSFNKAIPKNNTSGCVGVILISSNKWNARIRKDGKCIYLGNYSTFEEAVAARKKAEVELFGEYRYTEE